jgi:hypothetical protein
MKLLSKKKSGRWRQENAAGEAAERISALSGIGAGTSKPMAMAAGEDDADKMTWYTKVHD